MNKHINPTQIYTSDEAGKLLQLSRRTLANVAKMGELAGNKRGGFGWRFTGQALLNFVNKKNVQSNKSAIGK